MTKCCSIRSGRYILLDAILKQRRDAWWKLAQDPDFDPELIIKAAKNYAAANKGEMPKFIQQAHNFLKEETWRDYIEAPATHQTIRKCRAFGARWPLYPRCGRNTALHGRSEGQGSDV